MNAFVKHSFVIFISLTLLSITGCRKKTNITVVVFNPTTNKFKANVHVEVFEQIGGGVTTQQSGAIRSGETDSNGEILFKDMELRGDAKAEHWVSISCGDTLCPGTSGNSHKSITAGETRTVKFEVGL